jgi:hypothetical protein
MTKEFEDDNDGQGGGTPENDASLYFEKNIVDVYRFN